ncbi:MAG: diguanylate cyclase [Proteobacteria bacterium]|nr:diguanylate cyclase [Pseudomonadota bacterium]
MVLITRSTKSNENCEIALVNCANPASSDNTPHPEFLNHLFDGVILVRGGRVAWVNEAAKSLLGVTDNIDGAALRLLSPEADEVFSSREQGRYHFWRQRLDPATNISRRDVFIADTRWINESNGQLDGKLIFRDATDVVILEKKLINTSYKDDRSGLLTAVGFAELAGTRFSRRRKEDGLTVMIAMSVPELANYEMQPAVQAGILKDIAIRIRESLRGNDLAAYLGNNRFSVLLNNIPRLDQALGVAKRIGALVSAPFECKGETVRLQAMIGLAILGADGDSTDPLMQAAQRASDEGRPANGKSYAITFANKEIQKTAEEEAARAAKILQEILQGKTGFEVSYFRNAEGRACLIRPCLPDFSEEDVWEAYDQEGMAADLVRSAIDRSASIECDFFVISYPAKFRKIGNNAMALLAAERNMPISRFYSCHQSLPVAAAPGHSVGLAAAWDGGISLSQLKSFGVDLVLVPAASDNPILGAEVAVARQFFKVFSGEAN